MKSILGLVASLLSAAVFAAVYAYSIRPGASWLDGQWLFLLALPYNWTMLHVFGASNFSPDAPAELAAGALFNAALAYLAGAVVGFLLRRLLRLFARLTSPT